MTANTIAVLSIGTVAMLLPIVILMRRYRVKCWKSIPTAVILTITGTLGTYVWFLLETFRFGGRSFYGAVFLVPPVFVFISALLRIPRGELLDFCAPAECIMLAIMKYKCMLDECCRGRAIWPGPEGTLLCFPSQIVEGINALILCVVLIRLAFNEKNKGTIYPWYLILYGVSRFILNFFRYEWEVYDGGIPPLGTIWSVLAVMIGLKWLSVMRKRKTAEREGGTPCENPCSN